MKPKLVNELLSVGPKIKLKRDAQQNHILILWLPHGVYWNKKKQRIQT